MRRGGRRTWARGSRLFSFELRVVGFAIAVEAKERTHHEGHEEHEVRSLKCRNPFVSFVLSFKNTCTRKKTCGPGSVIPVKAGYPGGMGMDSGPRRNNEPRRKPFTYVL